MKTGNFMKKTIVALLLINIFMIPIAKAIAPFVVAAELIAEAGISISATSAGGAALPALAIAANDAVIGSVFANWLAAAVGIGILTVPSVIHDSSNVPHTVQNEISLSPTSNGQLTNPSSTPGNWVGGSYYNGPYISGTGTSIQAAAIDYATNWNQAYSLSDFDLNPSCSLTSPTQGTCLLRRLASDGFTVLYQQAMPFVNNGGSEQSDGIRRFQRSASGFKPDPADPDFYTYSQPSPTTQPGMIRLTAPDAVTDIFPNIDGGTQIDLTRESSPGQIETDSIKLQTSQNTPGELTSSPPVPGSLEDVPLPTDPGTDTGSNLEIPTDYARTGEAAQAANTIKNALDTIKDLMTAPITSGEGDVPSSRAQTESSIDALPQAIEDAVAITPSGVDSSWLPSILPGNSVACQAFPVTVNITHGPAAGIGGTGSINICDQMEIIRQIIGYLLGLTTIFYIWHTFMQSGRT